MIVKIFPENPNPKQIDCVVDVLRKGGVIIYPTDTIYAIGCDMTNHKAVERVARIKGIKPELSLFSILCNDLSRLSDYTRPVDNNTFKIIKRNTPGPFTFILNAGSKTPKIFQSKRKTVGIRIPDNSIACALVEALGNPLVTTTINHCDIDMENFTDPELIHEYYEDLVDLVIDGGMGQIEPSTVVDCSSGIPEIIRQGLGQLI